LTSAALVAANIIDGDGGRISQIQNFFKPVHTSIQRERHRNYLSANSQFNAIAVTTILLKIREDLALKSGTSAMNN
jgi:hypothetical protein